MEIALNLYTPNKPYTVRKLEIDGKEVDPDLEYLIESRQNSEARTGPMI